MRIILPEQFATQPWKNGGGVTHEIRKAKADEPWWRLSIAEVASDGPFSAFPGLTRILTVIAGAGMDMETPLGSLAAQPLKPVTFSGDLPAFGRLRDGPVRDLNLIFDASLLAASVTPISGPKERNLLPTEGGRVMVLCVAGSLRAGDDIVPVGALVVAEADGLRLALGFGATAMIVRIQRIV